jgi:branched-chain amino acid transport system permease protein
MGSGSISPILALLGFISAAGCLARSQSAPSSDGHMEELKWHLVDFFQALAAGLLVGGTYGLMCVGLGIIFGVMRVVNFAQGDFMMLGMYITYYLVTGFGVLGFLGPYYGPVVGAVLAGVIVFAIGWLIHRFLISRVTGARAISAEAEGHYAQIIMTLGVALMLSNGGLILFGSSPLSVQTPLSSESWEVGLIFFNQARTVAFGLAIISAIGLYLFLTRSSLGKALRAAADNPIAAAYVGIDVDRCHRLAFALGVGITAVAGGFIASSQSFQPYIGFDFVIVMYAGVVLGGMGSILGAFWGGLTIGLVQQMSTLVLPYQLQNTAIFVVFLLIIFFRPQGMFGRIWERA